MTDDPEFRAMINEGSKLPPGPERELLTKEAAQYWIGQAWYIHFKARQMMAAHWPWVMNYHGEYEAGDFDKYPYLCRVWIDQDLKTEMGY